jgi:hypothetical protein
VTITDSRTFRSVYLDADGLLGHLSSKFGTEYKIDVMIADDKEETVQTCDGFFSKHLPSAKLSITQPKTKVYKVPASDFKLSHLFHILEQGNHGTGEFNYYIRSPSSLAPIFMEIVRMSEWNNVQLHDEPEENKDYKFNSELCFGTIVTHQKNRENDDVIQTI